MIDAGYSAVMIAVIALVTAFLRFVPFVVFQKKTPKIVLYLGNVLPFAIMGMLVVYCLKGINFLGKSHGIPEAVSVLFVVLLHKWKHNTLLSILLGTLLYMFLIQVIWG